MNIFLFSPKISFFFYITYFQYKIMTLHGHFHFMGKVFVIKRCPSFCYIGLAFSCYNLFLSLIYCSQTAEINIKKDNTACWISDKNI